MRKIVMVVAVLSAAGVMMAMSAPAGASEPPTAQISLTPGVHIPFGDFADDLEEGGLGADPSLAIGLTGHYFLSENVADGNVSLMASIDYFHGNFGSADFGPFDVDISGSIWGFTAGGRYWFFGDRDWTPYVDAALGLYHASVTADVSGPGVSADDSESDTAFGFNIGAGADWAVGENFAVGPFARFHYAAIDDTFTDLEIGIALSYLVN